METLMLWNTQKIHPILYLSVCSPRVPKLIIWVIFYHDNGTVLLKKFGVSQFFLYYYYFFFPRKDVIKILLNLIKCHSRDIYYVTNDLYFS